MFRYCYHESAFVLLVRFVNVIRDYCKRLKNCRNESSWILARKLLSYKAINRPGRSLGKASNGKIFILMVRERNLYWKLNGFENGIERFYGTTDPYKRRKTIVLIKNTLINIL